MPDIAFLVGDTALARHDNHRRLPRGFTRAGWRVVTMPQEAVHLSGNGVRLGEHDPGRFELIWPLGLGRLNTFFDRMQLLHLLPQNAFVIPIDALMYWHAKYAWWRHMPETHASSDAGYLKARLADGGDWVLKPTAGSFGRDVMRISNDAAGAAAIDQIAGSGRYCLLQRYVPEICEGEKRTLVAGGRLIGTYLRRPDTDIRANLAAGGSAHPATLTAAERTLVESIAADLTTRGIGFAAVDTVFPYLMEVNLANPGGLATLETLYGEDPTPAVVDAVSGRRLVATA